MLMNAENKALGADEATAYRDYIKHTSRCRDCHPESPVLAPTHLCATGREMRRRWVVSARRYAAVDTAFAAVHAALFA